MTQIERYSCEQVFSRLDDYLDRALSPAEQTLVDQHLRECEVCAHEYRFEGSFIAEVRAKLRRIRAPRDLLQRISLKLEQSLS